MIRDCIPEQRLGRITQPLGRSLPRKVVYFRLLWVLYLLCTIPIRLNGSQFIKLMFSVTSKGKVLGFDGTPKIAANWS